MTKSILFVIVFCPVTHCSFSQTDTTSLSVTSDIFTKIEKNVKDFKLDTTAAPDDKITRKIMELRNLRGGFNINEAVDFKIEEDKHKNEIPKAEIEKFASFFKSGDGEKWLDNATVWIYRQHFSYNELKKLVKFYKTSAGQKMATEFPIIMMQSLTAAEMIKNIYIQKQKNKME
ncbi:MAG: DUF2059 domain-containing protein [Chitinophagales bacterium]|nr:DUF2059 domain-containing protein [Chitinophagales bacterium]